jgi:hypothetical protein
MLFDEIPGRGWTIHSSVSFHIVGSTTVSYSIPEKYYRALAFRISILIINNKKNLF